MALAHSLGQKAAYGYADLIDTDETLRCISAGAEFLGGIDILVNNVGGIVGRKWLGEIDRAFWQTVIDVNMTTMLNVTQSALPFLKAANGASIVNRPRRPAEPAGTPARWSIPPPRVRCSLDALAGSGAG